MQIQSIIGIHFEGKNHKHGHKHHHARKKCSDCVNVPRSTILGLMALAAVGATSIQCQPMDTPKPPSPPANDTTILNPPVDTLSTKSPVTKKLNNMLDILGLVAGTKSYSAANGDITRYSFYDATKGGKVFATLNEDESTENKLVYDRDIVDILENHSPGQVVLEPTADGIKTTFYDVDGLKIIERILKIKDGGVIESEDGENIYKYSKDTHNSLLVTKFSNNATFEISDINIVKK